MTMPLIVEAYDKETQSWIEVVEIMPGDPPGSVTDNNLVSGDELYLFICDESDRFSSVYRSVGGVDQEVLGPLQFLGIDEMIKIKEIKNGETFEKDIFTEISPTTRHIRLRHLTLDLGTRKCQICGLECQPWIYGQHIVEHTEEELKTWPGGVKGLLDTLKDSISESIEKTGDFPKIQDNLRSSLSFIERLEKTWKSRFN